MTKKNTKPAAAVTAGNLVIESPLDVWPGSIGLPEPNTFTGSHWRVWKDGVNLPKREAYSTLHLYFYAGLEMIAAFGT